MRRVARADPLTRFNLLTVKADGKSIEPILPLESDCPDALRNSPLFALIDPSADDGELSEIASSLMGPGPWTFHRDLKLPSSCSSLKFTNKNKRSNIVVSHVLKVVMRVERGDDVYVDPKTGRRKLFDIVVQTPILILSVSNVYWICVAGECIFTGLFLCLLVSVQSRMDFSAAICRGLR